MEDKKRALEQTAIAQVDLNDNIVHRRHDELDLACIGRTGKVGVDRLCIALVQTDETVDDVFACRVVVRTTSVIAKIVSHGRDGELLFEKINLVEEKNDGSLDKPSRVADAVKERQGFLHTVDVFILVQQLIVFRDGDEEDDRCDILKQWIHFLRSERCPPTSKSL